MTNEYESVMDEIKNEVILEMRNHVDSTTMTILASVDRVKRILMQVMLK